MHVYVFLYHMWAARPVAQSVPLTGPWLSTLISLLSPSHLLDLFFAFP